jgi:acetylornithine/N-succinyldiaminopimelate aminotransferase
MQMNNVSWDKAKGSKVKINGKWFIDFTSSIFSQNFGHNNPYVIKEVKKQLKKCSHAYGYETEIKEKFLTKLKEMTGYKNILLFSTGAEAIEATIKIALNNKYKCVGIKGAMHGRTLGAEALVGKRNLSNIDSIDKIDGTLYEVNKKAIFIEGYRGYDCKLLYDYEINILQENKDWGNLIIFDEIQSGFFRTEQMFIYQEYGIIPDILVIGKSIGGGFPLSAVCWDKDLNLEGIELTSTHSGQPLQMAAGYGVLKYIEDKHSWYNENIFFMDYFFSLFDEEVSNHLGMVGALKVDNEEDFYNHCFEHSLLVTKTGKGWIKIAPPININRKLLFKGLRIIKDYFHGLQN